MEWSGRAPAPPAIEAGQGRQRQGARHVSNTQNRDRSSRILATPPDVLSPHMVRVTRTWLERQISTGDRTILGKISKRGNRYLCDLVWAGVGLWSAGFWPGSREHGNRGLPSLGRPCARHEMRFAAQGKRTCFSKGRALRRGGL